MVPHKTSIIISGIQREYQENQVSVSFDAGCQSVWLNQITFCLPVKDWNRTWS